jgi:hypothetical protein
VEDEDPSAHQGEEEGSPNAFGALGANFKQAFTHGTGVGQPQVRTVFYHAE